MDFETLNRRELQALCKLNKIPANITNISMVEALKSLETVEGIEEFLNPSRSESAGFSIGSPERVEITSSRARVPRTSCRTSTRQKVNKSEAESLPATASRVTSRGARRQLGGDDNEFLKTPLVSSTRNNALASQLKECEDISKKSAVKQETTTAQRAYSTRRSTRLTAKKSDVPGVKEIERSEPVKIDSFLDEDSGNPIPEKGVSKAKVEDICNEFEKLDVVVDESDQNPKIEKVLEVESTLESAEEKVKSDEMFEQLENVDLEEKQNTGEKFVMNEVDNTEDKSFQVDNLKQDSESICNLVEDVGLEEKHMVMDEKIDQNEALNEEKSGHSDNLKQDSAIICNPVEDVGLEEKHMVVDEKIDQNEALNEEKSGHSDNLKQDSEIICNPLEDVGMEEKHMAVDQQIDLNEALNVNTENPSDPSILKLEGNGSPNMMEFCISEPPRLDNITEVITADETEENLSRNTVDIVHPNKQEVGMDIEASGEKGQGSLMEEIAVDPEAEQMIADADEVTREEAAADVSFVKEENQISDNKENNSNMELEVAVIEENEENINEDDKKVPKSLNDTSLRQLKKQLKALSIKHNMDDKVVGEVRPALQEMEN